MPPKAIAGSAAASSSKTQSKGKSEPVHLDRILNISVIQHTPKMTFEFIKSVVPEIAPFETEWIDDEVTGAALVSEGPTNFHSVLRASFAAMTAPLRAKIFSCFKQRLMEENHKGGGFISADVIKLWFPPGDIQPRDLFGDLHQPAPLPAVQAAPVSVVIGQPKHAFFQASPPAHLGLPQFSNFAGHQQQPLQVGQAAQPLLQVNTAAPPPLSSVAFQSPPPVQVLPPASAFAAQSATSALLIQGATSASHNLAGGGAAVPGIHPPLTIEQQFAASKSLFQAQGLSVNVSVKLPWVVRAEANPEAAQDPSMPYGFDRINVHAKITKAIADRVAKGAIGIHENVKKVVWPSWTEFNATGFRECRVRYYECVLSSLKAAIFQDFKDCLEGAARTAACTTFSLTDNQLSDLPDSEFMQWCEIFFGPKSASQALRSLTEIRFSPHRDKAHSQATFVQKFDTLNHTFLFAVNDIVKCHEFWPQSEAQALGSSFDVQTIMSKWSKAFPKQNPLSPISVQVNQVHEFYDLNKKMAFRDMIRILRLQFSAKDMEVAAGERAYTTTPTEADQDLSKTKQPFATQATPYRGAGRGQLQPPRQNPRLAQSPGSRPAKSDRTRKPIQQHKPVPGNQRCAGCGHPNNHFGLGSGANACPLHGTSYAKPKGYVWKSTADEPAVRTPTAEYKAILQAKPHLERNWTAAKAAKKVHVAAMRALVDDGSYDSSSDSVELHAQGDDAASEDSKSDDYVSEPARAVKDDTLHNPFASVAAVQADPHPLERFGYMPQFYAVARFAQNDKLLAKCLMDPGGAINIISPMLANRSAVERICTNVSIYTGNRKTGSVSEMVRVLFELMDGKGNYVKHSDFLPLVIWDIQCCWAENFAKIMVSLLLTKSSPHSKPSRLNCPATCTLHH
jgi:hypothetical protein